LPDDEEDGDQEDQPRSNRPGQQGFAERLMSKYGWKKGTGLGADSSGIVQPLHVKVSKGKEKKGTGQIIDRNKKRQEEQEGKFGKMSEVVVLKRMVDGMEDEDLGVLMQEIGDECAEKVCRMSPTLTFFFLPAQSLTNHDCLEKSYSMEELNVYTYNIDNPKMYLPRYLYSSQASYQDYGYDLHLIPFFRMV